MYDIKIGLMPLFYMCRWREILKCWNDLNWSCRINIYRFIVKSSIQMSPIISCDNIEEKKDTSNKRREE